MGSERFDEEGMSVCVKGLLLWAALALLGVVPAPPPS